MANLKTTSVFAQNVVTYFDSGKSSSDVPTPYGVLDNKPEQPLGEKGEEIVLKEYDGNALSLPKDSFVTVNFGDNYVVNGSGDDLQLQNVLDSTNSSARIEFTGTVITEDGQSICRTFNRTFAQRPGSIISIDLTALTPENPNNLVFVNSIKITGLNNGGDSPGFEVYGIEALNAAQKSDVISEIQKEPGILSQVKEDLSDLTEPIGFPTLIRILKNAGKLLLDAPGLAVGLNGVRQLKENLDNLNTVEEAVKKVNLNTSNQLNGISECHNFIGALDLLIDFELPESQINLQGGSTLNEKLSGTSENDFSFSLSGNDILEGNEGNDVLSGGEGNDLISGGDGSDLLKGSSINSIGEVDTLTGGANSYLFVLGDSEQNYYDDNDPITSGTQDYALITDFNIEEDFIVLKEDFSYIFKANETGVGIFLDNDGQTGFSSADEAIAQVQGVTELTPTDLILI